MRPSNNSCNCNRRLKCGKQFMQAHVQTHTDFPVVDMVGLVYVEQKFKHNVGRFVLLSSL